MCLKLSQNFQQNFRPDPDIKLRQFPNCTILEKSAPNIGIYRQKDIYYEEDTYTFIFWKGEF